MQDGRFAHPFKQDAKVFTTLKNRNFSKYYTLMKCIISSTSLGMELKGLAFKTLFNLNYHFWPPKPKERNF